MEYCKNFKNEYEKISSYFEEGRSAFELYLKKFAEGYHNFFTNHFINKGGL